MPTQKELDQCYMACAEAHAALSKAKRTQVGAALVTVQGIVIPGVNGLPGELGNECEYTEYLTEEQAKNLSGDNSYLNVEGQYYKLVTKQETIHAELNCILKAAREGVSVQGGTIYTTLSPCVPCASMILSAGIKEFVYRDKYRCLDGVRLLEDHIIVRQYAR